MVQIEITSKARKTLSIIGIIAFVCSTLMMTLFVQKLVYNSVLAKMLHVDGQFEYWREIMLNFSFTFSALSAVFLLIVLRAQKLELKSSTLFALAVFLSFALAQPLFMFNRWQTGLADGSYDFGDMFKASAASINMGEDICPPSSMLMYQIMRNTFPGIAQNGLGDYNAMILGEKAGYYIQLYFLFSVVPLVILSYFAISGTKVQKALFAAAIMLSRPVMIGFERGNSIMTALAFVMIFCLCYKSKDQLIHEIALLALACAFALKIYTAVFGVLLLKEKDIKSAVRCAIYAIFLFVFPAACHRSGFIESFKLYIEALSSYTANLDFGLEAAQLSLKRIVTLLAIALHAPDAVNVLYPIFMVLLVAVLAYLVIFSKKEWHTLLALSLATIMIPSLSWPYTASFLLIPLISLLNEKKKNKADYVSIILILWIFMFIYYDISGITRAVFKLNNWWIPMCLILIAALYDTIRMHLKGAKQ